MTPRAKEAARRSGARATRARAARRATPSGFRVSYAGARFGRFCHGQIIVRGRPLALEGWQLETFSELMQTEHDLWRPITLEELHDLDLLYRKTLPDWMEKAADKIAKRCNCPATPDGRELCRRIHREGLIGVSKKNGKSTISGGLALYLLRADGEPEAEVYATASTRDQARVVGRKVRNMVEGSPKLREQLRIYRDLIEYPALGGFFKVVSADAGAQEGIDPHGVVNDEVHVQKSRELNDVLRSAAIERWQPMHASITTAGKSMRGVRGSELTIAGELYQRGAGARPKIRNGLVVPRGDKQRSFYFRWYQADPKKAIRKKPLQGQPGNLGVVRLEELKKANPSPRITIEKLEEEASVERPLAIFLRYHGNIWISVERHWLPAGKWEACRGPATIAPDDPLIITLDVGLNYDTSAIIFGCPTRSPRPIAALVYGVHSDPSKPPPPAHRFIQDEPAISLRRHLRPAIEEIARGHRVLAFGADPHKAEAELEYFEDELGWETVRIDQGKQMAIGAETAYKTIGDRELQHDGDPILEAHIDNAIARDIGGGRFRLDKKNAPAAMDAAVGLAMFELLAADEELVTAGRPSVTIL